MKVVTQRGTFEINLERMKVLTPGLIEHSLRKVPTPIRGERMELETEDGVESTEPVIEVYK